MFNRPIPVCGRGDSKSYDAMSKQRRVYRIVALTDAVRQRGRSLSRLEIVDAVADICAVASKIDGRIPITIMGYDDPSGKHAEEASIGLVLPSGSESLKIMVVRKPYVALMAALNNNVASI